MSSQETSRQEHSRLPGTWTLIRDILTFVGGWVLTFMEVSRPEIREAVLILCGSLITVPGAFVGAAAVADSISRRQGGTPESPSSSQAGAGSAS